MKEIIVKNIENEGVVTMYTLQFFDENLSEFDSLIRSEVANGSLTISETEIEGITDKPFKI